MSGRGRGGGRKYTPPTGSKLQLQKAAEDCGFDGRNLRSLQTRPELYPDVELHSSGLPTRVVRRKEAEGAEEIKHDDDDVPPSAADVERTNRLVRRSRELAHRFRGDVFHVTHDDNVPDVARYSDAAASAETHDDDDDDHDGSSRRDHHEALLARCLGGRRRTRAGVFLPDELGSRRRRRSGRDESGGGGADGDAGKSLEELERRERARRRRVRLGLEPDDDDDNKEGEAVYGAGDEEEFQDVEEEFEGGYAVNHYESEGEGGSGGEDEATF